MISDSCLSFVSPKSAFIREVLIKNLLTPWISDLNQLMISKFNTLDHLVSVTFDHTTWRNLRIIISRGSKINHLIFVNGFANFLPEFIVALVSVWVVLSRLYPLLERSTSEGSQSLSSISTSNIVVASIKLCPSLFKKVHPEWSIISGLSEGETASIFESNLLINKESFRHSSRKESERIDVFLGFTIQRHYLFQDHLEVFSVVLGHCHVSWGCTTCKIVAISDSSLINILMGSSWSPEGEFWDFIGIKGNSYPSILIAFVQLVYILGHEVSGWWNLLSVSRWNVCSILRISEIPFRVNPVLSQTSIFFSNGGSLLIDKLTTSKAGSLLSKHLLVASDCLPNVNGCDSNGKKGKWFDHFNVTV